MLLLFTALAPAYFSWLALRHKTLHGAGSEQTCDSLGLLYLAYKPDFSSWAAANYALLALLALVAETLKVAATPSAQLIVFSALLVVYAVARLGYRPQSSHLLNALAMVPVYGALFTSFFSLFYPVANPRGADAVTALIFMVNLAGLGVLLWQLLLALRPLAHQFVERGRKERAEDAAELEARRQARIKTEEEKVIGWGRWGPGGGGGGGSDWGGGGVGLRGRLRRGACCVACVQRCM
jgi:hypothetical protein